MLYCILYNNQINARALIGQLAVCYCAINPWKKRAASELLYKSNRPQVSMVYLQVNALSERIIRIYLHEFTNNERENSIPHEAAECGIENFEFIVSERVQVNPDNSRAMSALTFLLFKLNTLQTKIVKP